MIGLFYGSFRSDNNSGVLFEYTEMSRGSISRAQGRIRIYIET